MTYSWTGLALEEVESAGKAIIIFGLGLLVVYLTLSAQYESFALPFIILLAVPMAILGALSLVASRGLVDDVYVQIGLVMLIGLSAKNSILIVEFAEQLLEQGRSIIEAAIEAAELRLRPILMTSIAFILGVGPLYFATGAGAYGRHSVGTAIVGGMVLSTVLNLFFIPVLYVILKTILVKFSGGPKAPWQRRRNSQPTNVRPGQLDVSSYASSRTYGLTSHPEPSVLMSSSERAKIRISGRCPVHAAHVPPLGMASAIRAIMPHGQANQPAHQSWLPDANNPTADFPLTHLPYGAFEHEDQQHLCVAIGTHLLDLHACAAAGLLPPTSSRACQAPNPQSPPGARPPLLDTPPRNPHHPPPRRRSPTAGKTAEAALHSIAGATLLKPIHIPNYTDFYASIHHATRVGQLFRPDQPLLPNYKHIPIGYHGRASSIIPSGIPITRPTGQSRSILTETQAQLPPHQSIRLRTGTSTLHRPAQPARAPPSPSPGRPSSLRRKPPQRLVRPRHPILGVPTPRPLPRQKLRHHHLPLGHPHGRPRTLPRPGRTPPCHRPQTPSLSPFRRRSAPGKPECKT